MSHGQVKQLRSANAALHVKIDERDRELGALRHRVGELERPLADLRESHAAELAALHELRERDRLAAEETLHRLRSVNEALEQQALDLMHRIRALDDRLAQVRAAVVDPPADGVTLSGFG